MEILTIDPLTSAFIRPAEGANVGLIRTLRGMVLIDTTSSPAEIQALFEAVHVSTDKVRLVVNTHSHSDHTWGNQVFTCPIIAHRLCKEQMEASLKKNGAWKDFNLILLTWKKQIPKKLKIFTRSCRGYA